MRYTVVMFVPVVWQGYAENEDEAIDEATKHFEADEKYKDDNVVMVKVIKHDYK